MWEKWFDKQKMLATRRHWTSIFCQGQVTIQQLNNLIIA